MLLDHEADSTVDACCRYYSKLLKEYALCDLSRYRDCMVGLRWRTEQEVVIGKGQFSCGAIGCEVKMGLSSFEVPFQYRERGEDKQVRVRSHERAGRVRGRKICR